MERIYKLEDFIPLNELNKFLESFGCATRSCCAIVRYPTEGEESVLNGYDRYLRMNGETPSASKLKKMNEDLGTLRAESSDFIYNQSPFCEVLRRNSKLADMRCIYCDYVHAKEAYRNRCAIKYLCHAGLIDMVAPIVVGDRHIASLFIGQNFRHLDKMKVDDLCGKYFADTSREDRARSKLYKLSRSPYNGEDDQAMQTRLESYRSLLYDLSQLLSMYASSTASSRIIAEIWNKPNIQTEPGLLIKEFFDAIRNIIDFDSGSYWIKHSKSDNALSCLYADWASPLELSDLSMRTDIGIGGKIMRTREPVYLKTRKDIEDIAPMFPQFRKKRMLGSLMGVPIKKGDEDHGFIEVGSTRENAFWPEAQPIFTDMARYMGLYVKLKADFSTFSSNFMETSDPRYILGMIVHHILELLGGISASIFMVREGTDIAYCEATTGIAGKTDSKDTVKYDLSQPSLTSWVINRNRPLVLENRITLPREIVEFGVGEPKTREVVVLPSGLILTDAQYKSLPFMMVPVQSGERAVGVLRIFGSRSGRTFTAKDVELAQKVANALYYMSECPFILITILTHGKDMLNNYERESIFYTLLTLITHGQGIGINRVLMFLYDATADMLEPIVSIGPARHDETFDVTIPNISDCLNDYRENYERIKGLPINGKVNRQLILDSGCEFRKVLTGNTATRVVEVNGRLSRSLAETLDDIGCTSPQFAVITTQEPESRNRYVLIYDNTFSNPPIARHSAFIALVCSLFERALINISRIVKEEDLRKEGWLAAAGAAAHNLGNKLPVVHDTLEDAMKKTKDKATRVLLEIAMNRTRSAITDVNLIRRVNIQVRPTTKVHMHSLHNRLQRYLFSTCTAAGIDLNIKCTASGDPVVLIDEERLLDVFEILFQNVYDIKNSKKKMGIFVDFMLFEKKDLRSKISLSVLQNSGYLCITFRDNGEGVPDNHKRTIFQASFTTKNYGWGVGLAYAAKVLENHKGFITEEGQYGAGADFRIYLPIFADTTDQPTEPLDIRRDRERISPDNSPNLSMNLPCEPDDIAKNGKMKVLIVEDDVFIAERIIRRFSIPNKYGYEFACLVARSENEYCRFRDRMWYDVAIIDKKLIKSGESREVDENAGIDISYMSTIWSAGTITVLFSASLPLKDCIGVMRLGAWDCIDKNDAHCFENLYNSVLTGLKKRFGTPVWINETIPALVPELHGQYVAFIDGKRVDSDPDIDRLKERVKISREKTRSSPVYIKIPEKS